MPATYEPIASTSVSAVTEAEFTSIPGTYTDLVLVCRLTYTIGSPLLRVNGDTGSNYSFTYLVGYSSIAGSARESSTTSLLGPSYGFGASSTPTVFRVSLMSYANTNVNKTVLLEDASPSTNVNRAVGLWRNTSAITSVKVYKGLGTMTGDLALYGIKAA